MLAHYGIDVLDPAVSLRRVWVLARRLPAGTWPDADSPMSWSLETHLLAHVIDQLGALTYVTLKAAGSRTATKPKPFPRPTPRRRPPARPLTAQPGRPRATGWAALANTLAGQQGVVVHHA